MENTNQLILGEVVSRLMQEDRTKILSTGLTCAHSYRGYYDQVAFELTANVSVGDMLKCVEYALGRDFTGWKGGEFKMTKGTPVWVANQGSTGNPLRATYLEAMLSLSNEGN